MNVLYAWFHDLGIRLDEHEPDARQLEHLAALREAKLATRAPSARARISGWLGFTPGRPAISPAACSCAA